MAVNGPQRWSSKAIDDVELAGVMAAMRRKKKTMAFLRPVGPACQCEAKTVSRFGLLVGWRSS
jgi:hypothetical protein